jgi:hypothetical protein
VLERSPRGALVEANELVDVLVLAVTGALGGMTGTELVVDGGYISGTQI